MPFANVELATVEEALIPVPNCKSPATLRRFANVEEAFAIMFCARRVEEAWSVEPETMRPFENVEEATARSPPD